MKFFERQKTKNFKNFKLASLVKRTVFWGSFNYEKIYKRSLFCVSFSKRTLIEVYEVVEVFPRLKHIGKSTLFMKNSRQILYVFYVQKNFRNFKNFKLASFLQRSKIWASFGFEELEKGGRKYGSLAKISPIEVYEVVAFLGIEKLHRTLQAHLEERSLV